MSTKFDIKSQILKFSTIAKPGEKMSFKISKDLTISATMYIKVFTMQIDRNGKIIPIKFSCDPKDPNFTKLAEKYIDEKIAWTKDNKKEGILSKLATKLMTKFDR